MLMHYEREIERVNRVISVPPIQVYGVLQLFYQTPAQNRKSCTLKFNTFIGSF